ncbi:uncharacterized protein AB675_12080 [Cyphellophora attinorum]|uniref:DUF7598 domain-containing protein n=1 Tax=Cyphellophora attinorum TaxID=1664694 RepID=A0A0N1H6L8_9EURO|nr:uncharacterized protein AB675_12080 [Phialophora attinorum]KPI38395.1 hypothetical protein AB675_12080 [Phialophora attinorum]
MRFFGTRGGGGKANVAGAGYIVLGTVRVMNIISLLTVIGGSGVLLVKTFSIEGFSFFAALSHVLRILVSVFLIISELNLFKAYFSRNWPLFSARHGFVMLGLMQLFLGITIFSELSHREARQAKLTMPFWRLTLAAGILMTIMSVINILCSYIFRDNRAGVTARMVRMHGAAAASKNQHYDEESTMASPHPNRATRYREFFLGRSKKNNGENRSSLPDYESTPRRGMNISSPISPAASSKYSHYHASDGPISPEAAIHPAERHGNMI